MTRIIDLDSHPTVLDLILHHLDLEPEQRIRRAGLLAMMHVSRGIHAQASRVLYRSVYLEDGDRERRFWDSMACDKGRNTAIASQCRCPPACADNAHYGQRLRYNVTPLPHPRLAQLGAARSDVAPAPAYVVR